MEQPMRELLKNVRNGLGQMEGYFLDFEKIMEDLDSSFSKHMDEELDEFEKKWSE